MVNATSLGIGHSTHASGGRLYRVIISRRRPAEDYVQGYLTFTTPRKKILKIFIAFCSTANYKLRMIAALYVASEGCYYNLPGIDPWDEIRDARTYRGPHPVIAHPPCKRWGRFWHGSTRKPHQFKLGDDEGCFAAALMAVRKYGGVLEHPADSKAWEAFQLTAPPRRGGWIAADKLGGATCCVYQGHYGHLAGKPTWLYAVRTALPELHWGKCEQRLHPVALANHGYAKARRIGMMAMVGGKDKEKIRDATPLPFRDLLISIVQTVTVELK